MLTARNEQGGGRICPGRRDLDADAQGKATHDPDATRLAISLLQEAGAIRECEEHGWMRDRADPHARERAFDIARRDPPDGVSAEKAVAEVQDFIDTIGDTCPECPSEPG